MFESRRKRFKRQAEATKEGTTKAPKIVSDRELFKTMGYKPKLVN